MPALQKQYGLLQSAMNQGEPAYMKEAISGASTTAGEQAALSGQAQIGQMGLQSHRAALGGNLGASVGTPEGMGAKIAQAMYAPRLVEAQSNIEQMDKLMGMGIGQGQQAGSGALTALGNQLQAIGGMRPYNAGYANILGALNAAGTIYGAGNQAGWFNPGPYTTAIRPGGEAGSSGWQGFSPSADYT